MLKTILLCFLIFSSDDIIKRHKKLKLNLTDNENNLELEKKKKKKEN